MIVPSKFLPFSAQPLVRTAVRLQYRLDSDKAKQASTSIQTDDELDIFIGRLQDLIVPGCLPSGRKSTCTPKNPVVQFEDAASLGNGSSSHPSKGVSSGTASGTTKQKTTPASSADPELDGTSRCLKLVGKLQERWKCKIHSKGTDKWCYSPSSGNICQTLTISNLSFWTIQVMEGLATIDEKPASLILDSVSRARSSLNQQGDMPMGQPGFPVRLIEWFSYLDTHGGRNKNGVVYSQFGPVLRAKGFSHLNHLSHKYIQLSDLEDWLGIEVGTVIDIFEYAEEDLEAARAGTLVLPSFKALDDTDHRTLKRTSPIDVPILETDKHFDSSVRGFMAKYDLDPFTGGGMHMWRGKWNPTISRIYRNLLTLQNRATRYDQGMRVGGIKCSDSAGGVIEGWILQMSSIDTYHKISDPRKSKHQDVVISSAIQTGCTL
ncbi:hypothetical protein HD554DRAFT_2036032 [Boletus coccyginus]|nr:hypothetical protein HD554DRAFT_2036032 [Boletus coccyginus]